ncbi:hypothetical protein CXT96_04770 [Akkermansia muciniphila]|jgi:hypothetical protein|nr:hypothetical protein CXT92_02145 [Akkermansia muciniphila]PNC88584.1 hypothetical protein CXT97_04880 [Akkermansia muciniphila]PNC93152.1 hypothetical protein CXT91_01970 [Akkermansia muciniphila]PNC98473.1 hypothetical protein CXT90_11945 [Akkermansia muciniphila]PND16240.1 hypothetical protein CXT96_04770 [Akkermansia muciniphila]
MKPLRRLSLHSFQDTGRGEEPRPDVYLQERGAGNSGRIDEEKRFPEETATAVPALPALS